jgi:hypothetical protein
MLDDDSGMVGHGHCRYGIECLVSLVSLYTAFSCEFGRVDMSMQNA